MVFSFSHWLFFFFFFLSFLVKRAVVAENSHYVKEQCKSCRAGAVRHTDMCFFTAWTFTFIICRCSTLGLRKDSNNSSKRCFAFISEPNFFLNVNSVTVKLPTLIITECTAVQKTASNSRFSIALCSLGTSVDLLSFRCGFCSCQHILHQKLIKLR